MEENIKDSSLIVTQTLNNTGGCQVSFTAIVCQGSSFFTALHGDYI